MITRLGRIIKQYRKEKGYTQFEMAEKIGVSEFYKQEAENPVEKH